MRIIRIFGVLDFIAILFAYDILFQKIFQHYDLWNIILSLVIIVSYAFSGYFLIKKKRVGAWVYFAQFPLKLLVAQFTFNFLYFFNYLQFIPEIPMHYIGLVCLLLEVVRLLLTISFYKSLT